MTTQVEIKFTATGCTAVAGNFAPGDLLRCSSEWANHLVNEAKCAEYVNKPQTEKKPTAKTAKE